MKKIIAFIIIMLFVLLTINVFAAPPSNEYQLLFADEFDGEALNTDVWAYRTNTKTGGVNKPENVRVEDGIMYIDYKKVDDTYTSGGVISKFSFPYGYYETRAKVYGKTGALHTSFWLHGFSENDEQLPDIPKRVSTVEIDGFEINSHTSTHLSYGTYYNWAGSTSRYRNAYEVQDWSEDYFVMGIEWLPDRVNFYVDGVLVGTDEDFGVYGPSHMWLTALAQPEDREHLIDDSLLPGYSEFDYYRFYQMPIKGLNLLGNGHFEYDRKNTSTYPRCYVVKGDIDAVRATTTYESYEGIQCMTHSSEKEYEAFSGQKFEYIVPGKYTYSGMFKASSGLEKAKMVVYDRNGKVIAEKEIPVSDEWIKLSIENIDVDGFAYVAVESASEGGTVLMVDNLEFFIQDGIEYTETTEPDYLEYNSFSTRYSSGFYSKCVKNFESAVSVVGNWIESSLGSGTYFSYYDENNSVEWEFTADATDIYYLDVYRQINSNNMEKQKYTVCVNDSESTEYIIPTKDAKEGWAGVTTLALNEGDVVKVKLSSGAPKGFIRVSEIRLIPKEIKDIYMTPVFMLGDARMIYNGNVYFEDGNKKALKTHKENGEYYLPVGMLKNCVGLDFEAEEGMNFISATELKQKTGIEVIHKDGYLYLKDRDFELSDYALAYLIYDIHSCMDITRIKNIEQPAAETENAAINYTFDDAYTIGAWKHSGLGGGNDYSTYSGKAMWTQEVPESGNYKVQFRSVSHENSNPSAKLTVFAKNLQNTYLVNQKTGLIGWYDLGTYRFDAGELFTLFFEGYESLGLIRAGGVRLIPLPDGMTLNQDGKNVTVSVIKFAEGTSGKLLLAEYKNDGSLLKLHIEDAAASVKFTLENQDSDYKIMLWKSFETMQPLCAYTEK